MLVLRKNGFYKPLIKPKKKYIPKPYNTPTMLGEKMQMDVKYVPKSCCTSAVMSDDKFYQYTIIDEATFYYCKNLVSVTIPNSVTNIHETAFENCSKELVFIVDNNNYVIEYSEKNNKFTFKLQEQKQNQKPSIWTENCSAVLLQNIEIIDAGEFSQ